MLSRFLVGAAIAASLLMSASATAGAATLPPTLDGEALAQHTIWNGGTAPACESDAFQSGASFCVDGTATGPYPGTFHEAGTFTVVSTDPNATPDENFGDLTSYVVRFTINSAVGLVSGSEVLSPSGSWQYAGGIGGHDQTQYAGTAYSAIISLPDGSTYSDAGTTNVTLDMSRSGEANWIAIDMSDVLAGSGNPVTMLTPPTLTLSNLTATVSGSSVDVSVHTSPAIVNVTLDENGAKVAPDTTPVNGVASWTLTGLAPGTHTLAVQGWDSPSGQPGDHSGVQTFVVTVPPPPTPPPPPPPSPSPTPQPALNPAPTPSEPTSPPSSLGGSTPPASSTPVAPTKLLLPSKLGIPGLLRQGGYTWALRAPRAGRLVVAWYRGRTLIATGGERFTEPGVEMTRIRLTATGRRLLRHARSLRLIAKATYTPAGGSAVSVTRALRLVR